ncbi:MAG: rhodoquinone biosynthesis methyltransferase RquA [Candidatus Thiodiazotropha sp. (ex. Lucinisca nassula)]|nr:rhodoquinone biosynthesis methyltransferase RquA [Candidatus Thiodiazotropha sp. (ex. Lucinisca nassula)]MBW9268320.1 rhodoquinone biosynthesis methyltransferase RquA [Candidatus Thiodiazotropha sp. (ex. Lucinisca nassula)]RLW62082.1 MAG: methyltransferase [gamma proteobacterium symbiont of Stewartia floridana]
MQRSSTVDSGRLTAPASNRNKEIPSYLEKAYWWAYLHPRAVRFFERQWLVNLILWGNFNILRDAVLEKLGHSIKGKTLQVACVYGDFTPRLAQQLMPGATLDIVDVAPVQLDNTHKKLGNHGQVKLHQQDSSKMDFQDGEFDNTVVFFLLHEQPEPVRLATIAEAIRVTAKGGRIVFVDYHQPAIWNPMRYLMKGVFKLLEPYAENFWSKDIENWAKLDRQQAGIKKRLFFGGLYQMTSIDLHAS